MIDRYCLIIFTPNDSDAMLYPQENGEWVKYSEAQEKIDLVISIFEGLKNVSLNNTTAEELNTIVSQAIEVLK